MHMPRMGMGGNAYIVVSVCVHAGGGEGDTEREGGRERESLRLQTMYFPHQVCSRDNLGTGDPCKPQNHWLMK